MKTFVLIGAAALLCAAGEPPQYRTVSWFAAHPQEMAQTLRWCRDNAGLMRHVPACINADEAQPDAFLRRAQIFTARKSAWDANIDAVVCRNLQTAKASAETLRINGCL
jgi:UDP-N-acetylmuramate-alanine ligase